MVICYSNPPKKVQYDGPAHGRPMPLLLPSWTDVESSKIASPSGDCASQQHKPDGTAKGKQVALEHTLSFYPGHGDNNHPLACLDHGNLPFHTPLVNDDSTKTEDLDSVDDTAALSLKHPSKFSESLAVE
ncbi:hypothetical protein V8E53_008639, partial [Lactarius tabidus]